MSQDAAAAAAAVDGANSEVLSVLTCPICLGMYKKPTILPQCGHSFCWSCIKQLVDNNQEPEGTVALPCPECRTVSKFSRSMTGLHTNFQLDKAIKFYIEANPTQKIPILYPAAPCPHIDSVLEPVECKHCQTKFCHVCLFRHIERVRLELTWAGTGLEARHKTAVNETLNEKVDQVTALVEAQVVKVKDDIKKANEEFIARVTKAIADYEERSFDKVRKIADEQISSVKKAVDSANLVGSDWSDLAAKITKVNNSSLLFLPAEKITELFKEVFQKDKLIAAVERLQQNKYQPEISAKENLHFAAIVEQLEKLEAAFTVNKFHLSSPPNQKIVTEVRQVHEAAEAGDLSRLKEILLRSSLSRACRRFAAEHHGEYEKDVYKMSPLIEAAKNGHLDVVRFLALDQDVHPPNKASNKEFLSMAIQMAAENGHLDIVKFLVEAAANREAAASAGPEVIAKKMEGVQIEEAASTATTATTEVTTPAAAIDDNKPNEVAKRKRRLGDGDAKMEADDDTPRPAEAKKSCLNLGSAIRSAIFANHIGTAKYLIAQSDLTDETVLGIDRGATLLHSCAADGHLDAVRYLISELKVEPDAASIHVAAQKGHAYIVAFFLDHKPELVLSKVEGKTLVEIAHQFKHHAVLRFVKAKLKAFETEKKQAAGDEQAGAAENVQVPAMEGQQQPQEQADADDDDENEDNDDDEASEDEDEDGEGDEDEEEEEAAEPAAAAEQQEAQPME